MPTMGRSHSPGEASRRPSTAREPADMEFVFVLPRERLFPECYPQGFVPFGPALDLARFEATVLEHGFFVERARAERTPAWKQIIPYTVVRRDTGEILLMRRLAKGGEGRLHGKLSIGVGGHVNPPDASSDPAGLLAGATRREIAEEIEVEGETELLTLGLINDDSNPVGAVHVGLAQLLTVSGSVRIKEDDVLAGELVAPERLKALRDEGASLETWSSILIDGVGELFTTTIPQAS